MTKLGLDAGPGSDGTLSSSSRLLRSEGAGCTRLLDNWRTFNTSADLGVPGIVVTHILDHFESFVGSDGDLNEAKITETIKILNTINTRFENDSIFICVFVIYLLSNLSPTLESDIGSCSKETSRSNLAIVQIRCKIDNTFVAIIHTCFSRFFMFWANWFKDKIVKVKILIISLSFDLSTTTAAPTQVNIYKLIKS